MPKREKFSGYIKCTKCGTDGQAHFEENENPMTAGSWDTVLEGADEPFEIRAGSIFCECGEKVR